MDEYLSSGYSEPCGQCAGVAWGVSDEGQLFCKNCHNVIEGMTEVADESTIHLYSRITKITKPKNTVTESARQWIVCEGFQFILKCQADALVSLGVCLEFKTDVVWNFWKRYLQNTRQAFVNDPISTEVFIANQNSESESETESVTCSENSFRSGSRSETGDMPDFGCFNCRQSGSLDALSYINRIERNSHNLMTMPKTLAICYLALLWVREAITLADLLRLVKERRVPYLNIHDDFPEDMKLFGRDSLIFRVESIPLYSKVHKEALNLAQVMKLPSFPSISQDCLLHPIPLTVRYLLESNLPDGLLVWVHKVTDQAALGDNSFLTFNPVKPKPALLCYDIQAVAIIIVTMKLLFKLDDRVEWTSPGKIANEKKKKVFNAGRWYKIMHPALERARQKTERMNARQLWKSYKPIITSQKKKSLILKKRRVAEYLQHRFKKLTNFTPDQQSSTTTSFSSFHFHWGKGDGSDGPRMHKHRLNCSFKKKGVKRLTNRKYWHTALRICSPICGDHFSDIEPSLPRMYLWLLDLFSFLLGVSQAEVHREVLNVERRFTERKARPVTKKTPSKKRKPLKKITKSKAV